jgi:hypothetical protein
MQQQKQLKELTGLYDELKIAIGAVVMVSNNLWSRAGISNGTVGVVVDILFDSPSTLTRLPKVIIVQSSSYKGPSYLQDVANTFPVYPIRKDYAIKGTHYSRTQFPLSLAWAITIHKSQSLSLPAVYLNIGEREFSHGLTYVGLSRVIDFLLLSIVGTLDYQRYVKIFDRKVQERVAVEKYLDLLAASTRLRIEFSPEFPFALFRKR